MVMRRSMRCLWPVLLAEIALAASPIAAKAQEAEHPSSIADHDQATSPIEGVEEMTLYLETSVNALPLGIAIFTMRGQDLWVSTSTIEQLGLVLDQEAPDEIRLADVPGLEFTYDVGAQELRIMVPVSMLSGDVSEVKAPLPSGAEAISGTGLIYNYNIFGGIAGDTRTASAFSELRAYSPLGVASTTFLTQAASQDGDWSVEAVRLDSSVTASFPNSLLVASAGDNLTAATNWSRSTRFGGLQIGTDFALQPYLITTPLTQFFGETALPSTIELYVDGLKQATGEVPPGPFQISAPSGGIGYGSGQVLITDALGQVSTIAFDLYHTPVLLRRGLADWTVEAGFLRRAYGIRSFDYAPDPFVSGTIRRGMTDKLTLEAHSEASTNLVLGGVGANWQAGQFGVFSGSISHSRTGDLSGTKYTLGYSWSDRQTSLSFNLAKASSGFRDLAALEESPLPRKSISAQLSHSLNRFGTFGASYVDLDFDHQPRSRYVSAYWSKSLGRNVGLNLQASADLGDTRNRSIFATISVRFGDRSMVSASLQRDRDTTFGSLDASSSIPDEGGFGWRAQVQNAGSRQSGAGEVQHLGDHGRIIAGGRVDNGRVSGYAGVSGSLVLSDGSLFAAREIHDSFAVVSTDGISGVPVKLRNNVVGETGANGKLLVTGLNAYENNRIAIDVLDLPADIRINAVEATVTPADRSGTAVRFEMEKIRAASLILVDGSGEPLPLGSRVSRRGDTSEPAIVGFDGAVYFEMFEDSNVIDVETSAGKCSVRFEYPQSGAMLPQIGPLTCLAEGTEK